MVENLRYKSVFEIIGPVMVGPSSSHTAGACRIGKIVRTIFGEIPDEVTIYLYGSFAKTYRGHGTDIALVGGVLGMEPDDLRLPNSLKIAFDSKIAVSFVVNKEQRTEHANTARLIVKKGAHKLSVTGVSIGGGNIEVRELNGFSISLTMGVPTFIIVHQDVPGMIAKVTKVLSSEEVNIAQMNVTRSSRGEEAIMMIEVDTPHVDGMCDKIKAIPNLCNVSFFD